MSSTSQQNSLPPPAEEQEQIQDPQQLTTTTELESVDPSLSSIAAFNASFNAPNTWEKRPDGHNDANGPSTFEPSYDPPPAKRQRLETQHIDGVVPVVNTHEMQGEVAEAHIQNIGDVTAVFADKTGQPGSESQYENQHHEHDGSQNGSLEDDGLEHEFDLDESDHENEHLNHINVWNLSYGDPSCMLWDANQNLRIQSLPILDNLSSQILTTLGKGPYQETLSIVTQPESDQGQAYFTMKSLFDQTKKLYTPEAFLSADDLKLDLPEQRTTVRKVNLATFVSSVFGSQEVGFFHLNEHFLDTFVPDGGRLLKSQGALYLDLKTQAYISAMSTNERAKDEILTDLFPDDMKEILLHRRPGAKALTPSEADFVARLIQRKGHLMHISDDVNLSEKYVWQDFLKEVSWYVSKNYEVIVSAPMRRARKRKSSGAQRTPPPPMSHQTPPPPPIHHQQMMNQPNAHVENLDVPNVSALATHNSLQTAPQPPLNPEAVTPAQVNLEAELFGSNTSIAMSLGAPPAQAPIPQQSAPTQVLYERARLAATAKASPSSRRAGLPSQRRPWSTDEENALMAGLDRVKGPHWSQILAMFGPGGTVNEMLKDRNQVQLKDKARNLKLFFLKSGIEVPYYLQFVTGELKTRAPGQAAKNAAKKGDERGSSEDIAHANAITAHTNIRGMDTPDMQRMDGQELGVNMMDGTSQSPQNHSPTDVAPTADMGMGLEVPGFEDRATN